MACRHNSGRHGRKGRHNPPSTESNKQLSNPRRQESGSTRTERIHRQVVVGNPDPAGRKGRKRRRIPPLHKA